ncbi:uncharacterized protein LOC135931176 isoform X2 [Gordionus sp. m RMFG-2023]|uniref:uncharacterized protein LOC135931176 isoform X2 n=1 Tax=Gordionus sp. m RMFG-2023 TaxID=3053472 RepID=UPI0031FC63EE
MNGLITNYYHKYQKITQEDENIPDVIPAKEFSLNQANDINFFNDMNHRQIQQHKINAQNEQLEKIGGSIKVLKDMSHQISGELDHQSVYWSQVFVRYPAVSASKEISICYARDFKPNARPLF